MDWTLPLALAFVVVATLYASVGHAGASGYLAVMALVGIAPATMRPTALALNILAATIVTVRFGRGGWIRWGAVLPFVIGSVPFAFLGGALTLPGAVYKPIVGLLLLLAAVQLARTAAKASAPDDRTASAPPLPSVGIGAAIGLLSGLTGTGGGIFLTPLLVLTGWAGSRTAAGISAVFILCNSTAGLLGNVAALAKIPAALPLWLAAAAIGAVAGSELGTRRLGTPNLRRALAVVLVIAGLKLIFLG